MKNIIKALLEAQKQMGNATKDSKNPYFKSKYADLNSIREACMPLLNANGIVVLQPIVTYDGKNYVKTMLIHESGESIDSMTEIIYSKQNDAQAQGSGITYARRYGLQSLINIGAEDDDGNAASKPVVNNEIVKATDEQKNYIDSLLHTSTIAEEHKQFVENNLNDFSFAKAQEIIEKLKANQVDSINGKGTGTQTEIKNKLKQL